MNRYKILILLILSVFLNANEQKLESVTLQLQWKHQFEFAGYYAAKEKGFYRDAGLDVEFVEFQNDTNLVEEVLSQRAHYGVSYSSIIADYLNEKPIVLMANFFKQSPLVLVTQKHIKSISQLKGGKIEGLSYSIHDVTLNSMLGMFSISLNDVKTTPPTFKIDAFVKKEVDAMSVFTTNELFLLDKAGVRYNVFDPVTYGAKYYDNNLFTSKKEVLDNPQRVQKFKEASIKGWEYALKNQSEIIELILEKYNTQRKSKESLIFEAKQIEQIMLPKVHEIGSIDSNLLKIIAENFIQSGYADANKNYDINNFIFKEDSKLTEEDLEYLKNKKRFKICVDPSWMPIEAIIGDEYTGIGSDYLDILREKLGINIDVFKTTSWSSSLEAMKNKKCDILSLSSTIQEREKYFKFTEPLLELSLVIVALADKKSVISMNLLKDKKIAIVKNYALVQRIYAKYPYINIVEVDNINEGLRMVENGEVFGYADSASAIDYEYNNGSYEDFKVIAGFEEKLSLALGVDKDNTQLYNLLQKVVRGISDTQKQNILKKWSPLEYKSRFDYELFWRVVVVLSVILFLVIYVYRSVKRKNKKLMNEVAEELQRSKQKDRMIFHQSKLAAMGEMIQNIAHQWRQPLSQVNSAVLVIDDVLDEKGIKNELIEEKLTEIESLTQYMSKTINDFRDYFSHDKIKENFTLENIVEKSINILNGKINANSIELINDLNQKHICFGYPNELQQVLLAILNNAIDALLNNNIENPKIKIDIKRERGYNYISICDNAKGISEDDEDKIFEPYYTTKHKTKGTGLGLYISKLIVQESLGGDLSVENINGGACFTIKLKVKDE